MPTYQIRNWVDSFEISQSKKVYKRLMWVAMPNKHDGKGFRRISLHADAVEIFCAWVLIVQVASKMKTRGLLVDDDGPLDADDLAVKTGFPSEIFEKAFAVLTEPKIGWLEVVDNG